MFHATGGEHVQHDACHELSLGWLRVVCGVVDHERTSFERVRETLRQDGVVDYAEPSCANPGGKLQENKILRCTRVIQHPMGAIEESSVCGRWDGIPEI